MHTARPGRVIVGVTTSLSGLQALRVGVAEARVRGRELHAVRVADPPATDRGFAGDQPGGLVSPVDDAAAVISQAFADTMGSPPADIDIHQVVMPDPPGAVLVEYACRDADLLVIGAGRRSRLRRPWGSRVVRYCVAHAGCAVLVVPPPPLIRSTSTRSLVRRLRRDLDQLTSDQPG